MLALLRNRFASIPRPLVVMKDAFLTLSTGEKIQSPQFLKQSLKELRISYTKH